jgi:hypothetical protein
MADLGEKQIAAAERMYAEQSAMANGIASQQLAIAQQSAEQGQDYFDYLKEFRPAERAMLDEAMADNSAEIAEFDAANQADAAALTADDSTVYEANRGAIDNDVGRAVADAQGGHTRALNQAIRQGLRYGGSVSEMAGNVGALSAAQASSTASAANGARTYGIDNARQRIGTRLQLRGANKSAKNGQEAIGWAKKLDAAGLVKGLPGASTGAYSVAVGAGDSAMRNTMAPGALYQDGLAKGASTVGQGRQLYQGGLSGVLNSQTSVYNTDAQNSLDVGGLLSGGAALAKAGVFSGAAFSDRRLKENIEAVGVDEATGLTLYEFNYIADERRFRGVMADEVEKVMPEAVLFDKRGYRLVDYGRLGIEMREVACA